MVLAVTVAAVSGCVAVPAHRPGPAHVPAAAEDPVRGAWEAGPAVSEAPPREALESTGPPAPGEEPVGVARRPRAGAAGTPAEPVRRRAGARSQERRARPAAPRPTGRSATGAPQRAGSRLTPAVPRIPAVPRPPVGPPAPVAVPDVCALSEEHGAWGRGSQGARACRQAARR
ncbi:hypothetical protein BJP40_25955 [Streptomyces sp. CC53]|nr:hypothetical protein BJP40_25955 [Streptomyces sp. CC53]